MRLKRLLLTLPLLFALSGCNTEKTITGRYSFQLGNESSTHAAIHLNLTDEKYEDEKLDPSLNAKKFVLSFDISGAGGSSNIFGSLSELNDLLNEDSSDTTSESEITTSDSASEEITSETTSSLIDNSSSEAKSTIDIDGYYYLGETDVYGDTQLLMGINILEMITINEIIVEKIIYATVNGDTVNVKVPVSIQDLQFQLYWYGYRVSSIFDLPVELPKEDPFFKYNAIGTHPTADDVTTFREYQAKRKADAEAGKIDDYAIGEDVFLNYNNYHTLNMGLSKNG